ncbi:MAG: hypothetical protein ABIO29_01100, partial [Sphingomicrobium sp.]
ERARHKTSPSGFFLDGAMYQPLAGTGLCQLRLRDARATSPSPPLFQGLGGVGIAGLDNQEQSMNIAISSTGDRAVLERNGSMAV